jgi:chorismate mutase/prephenate dehydratase
MSDGELDAVRERIDELDKTIQKLLNERAECAMEVARIKLAEDPDAQFYRPEREAQVLRKVMERNRGPLTNQTVARIFREIMSACLALEKPLQVAFLGPEGTFTQAAALKHFGHAVETCSASSIADIFRMVETKRCHYGVVPVENSTEGVITHTLDIFIHSPLNICGEVMLRIHHNLLTHSKKLSSISQLFSHQQSLAQCRAWLDHHLPGVERIAVGSNAEAARMAAEEGDGVAAIAGITAAEIYQVPLLERNIEDERDNTTRFLIVGYDTPPSTGNDKSSLLLTTRNESGALHQLLTPLADHGISMSRIESRPSRRDIWDYVFFVDIAGHVDDPDVAAALVQLKERAAHCKVLGSYAKAVL